MFQVAKQFFLDLSFFLAEVDEKCRYQNIGRGDLVSNLVNDCFAISMQSSSNYFTLLRIRFKSAFATKTNKFIQFYIPENHRFATLSNFSTFRLTCLAKGGWKR